MQSNFYTIFESAGGFCGLSWNGSGINRFQLPTDSETATENLLLRRIDGGARIKPPTEIEDAVELVKRYLTGQRIDFSTIRLDLADQDEIFRNIYASARSIGWGHTSTYGTIAKELGFGPEMARVVGQAMAKNPVALIIPCHRVLAAGGKLGGFSAPGGSVSKTRMLELEGVRLAASEPAQQSFGF